MHQSRANTTPEVPPKTTLFQRGLEAAGERPEDWVDGFGRVREPATGVWLEPGDWLEIERDTAMRRVRRGLWPGEHSVNSWALKMSEFTN